MKRILSLALPLFCWIITGCSGSQISKDMPKTTDEFAYLPEGLEREEISSLRIKNALARVPRHEFVPLEEREHAYEDRALSIGSGQTISQPFIVALMSEQSGVTAGSRVLEIGTGSGYQAAVLAELGARVFSVEVIPELAETARTTLARLGYLDRISLKVGDGWEGWKEEAPFDAILITASSPKVPENLLKQLANNGRLILPLEMEPKNLVEQQEQQAKKPQERLIVIEKQDGDYISRDLGRVRFVPLTGEVRELENLSSSPLEKMLKAAGQQDGRAQEGRARFSGFKSE